MERAREAAKKAREEAEAKRRAAAAAEAAEAERKAAAAATAAEKERLRQQAEEDRRKREREEEERRKREKEADERQRRELEQEIMKARLAAEEATLGLAYQSLSAFAISGLLVCSACRHSLAPHLTPLGRGHPWTPFCSCLPILFLSHGGRDERRAGRTSSVLQNPAGHTRADADYLDACASSGMEKQDGEALVFQQVARVERLCSFSSSSSSLFLSCSLARSLS